MSIQPHQQPMNVYMPDYGSEGGGRGGGSIKRSRLTQEVINDAQLAPVMASALNGVTQMALDSMEQVDALREKITARHPALETALLGLQMNHARNLAHVQNSITRDEKKVR